MKRISGGSSSPYPTTEGRLLAALCSSRLGAWLQNSRQFYEVEQTGHVLSMSRILFITRWGKEVGARGRVTGGAKTLSVIAHRHAVPSSESIQVAETWRFCFFLRLANDRVERDLAPLSHFTRVMTTAISLETRMGNLEYAMALGIVLILLTMTIYSLVYLFNLKRR